MPRALFDISSAKRARDVMFFLTGDVLRLAPKPRAIFPHPTRWLRTRKNAEFRDFPNFSGAFTFFPLTLSYSSLTLALL